MAANLFLKIIDIPKDVSSSTECHQYTLNTLECLCNIMCGRIFYRHFHQVVSMLPTDDERHSIDLTARLETRIL